VIGHRRDFVSISLIPHSSLSLTVFSLSPYTPAFFALQQNLIMDVVRDIIVQKRQRRRAEGGGKRERERWIL
jgi:hypothetical protein